MMALGLLISACATTPSAPGEEEPGGLLSNFLNSRDDAQGRGGDPLQLAELERRTGDPARAQVMFSAILDNDPDNIAARLGWAESALSAGDAVTALNAFAPLTSKADYAALARQGMGVAHLLRGELDQAEPLLRAAVQEDEALWRSWDALGRVFANTDRLAMAEQSYTRALRYAPRPAVVHNNHGYALLSAGRYRDASEAFTAALRAEPSLEIARVNRTISQAMLRDYGFAEDGRSGEAAARDYNNAGYVAMLKKDYAEAERLFALSLKASPVFYEPAFQNMQALARLRASEGR